MSASSRRIRIDLAYDGTRYHGWQVQSGAPTVQGVLEEALSRLQGGTLVRVRGAGRTDAGVHARGQVADCELRSALDDGALLRALASMLPIDVRPTRVLTIEESFDARGRATSKTYCYRLDRSPHGDPFLSRFALHAPRLGDRQAIDAALDRLPGRKDWSGFAGSACDVDDTVRHLQRARFEELDEPLAVFTFTADGFLNHMVRNLVGTLLEIARGRFLPERIDQILASGDRNLAGPTAPARGLCLESVTYAGYPDSGRGQDLTPSCSMGGFEAKERSMSKVLVTGGAGYIGSHIVRRLLEMGRDVLVLDDISEGHRAAIEGAPLHEGDFGDQETLELLLRDGDIRFVVHMAASCLVGESVADPGKYYQNNLVRSLTLLDAVRRNGIAGIVFSSTAAVYGDPVDLPITEEHALAPTNPYGETKLAFERALAWYHRAHGTRYAALRYFNAAGAHPDGDLGEHHLQESHLIPRLLQAILDGGPPTPIFGEDYPTSDGTCVRDYVHVVDLAEAHVLALDALERGAIEAEAFNLGNGEGFTVREVIDVVERVTGEKPPTEKAPRRPGDPAVLVASSERAARRLGWKPDYPSLEAIIRTAWDWHRKHPRGYDDATSESSAG